jgi:hypothetical protein
MSDRSILFGQSYFLRFDPKLWEAMMPYPPLGTLYAASAMREKGYEVYLFDAMLADSEEDWEIEVERLRPAYAVLFEDNFNYLSKMCLLRMREAAFTMIGMAARRGCTVIVCGADASDHPDLYLARGADFVLLGEGEETLGDLLDFLYRTAVGTTAQASPHLGGSAVQPSNGSASRRNSELQIVEPPVLDLPVLETKIPTQLPLGLAWQVPRVPYAALIDAHGMREVQLWDVGSAVEQHIQPGVGQATGRFGGDAHGSLQHIDAKSKSLQGYSLRGI